MEADGRWWRIAAATLFAVFIMSRALLVATSYDDVANWEEPVFLYGGIDLGERGLAAVFDYQDDLSHGGSIPLVLLATGWVRTIGPRLDLLKGIAILWSCATLLVLLWLGMRFACTRVALLAGLLYAGASAPAAMLQVTLVGSHPESLLFMALALGAYLRTLENDAGGASSFLLGATCGAATWCSYLAAPLAAALGTFHIARRPRYLFSATCGALAGFSPWIVQNLILRPHGALQWTVRTAHADRAGVADWSLGREVSRSLAGGGLAGGIVLVALVVASAWAVLGSRRTEKATPCLTACRPAAVLPVVCAILLSAGLLLAVKPRAIPGEGFYYDRFFAPLQLLLFWLGALGIENATKRGGTSVWTVSAVLIGSIWIVTQTPLYTGHNSYVPDRRHDVERGCAVFGHAEVDRAGSGLEAVSRLEAITDAGCRRAAFTGYGWGLVSRYTRDGDGALLAESLSSVPEQGLRKSACESARWLMANLYEGAMSADRRRTGVLYIDSSCNSSAVEGS